MANFFLLNYAHGQEVGRGTKRYSRSGKSQGILFLLVLVFVLVGKTRKCVIGEHFSVFP